MRMDVLTPLTAADGEGGRELGAIVARANPGGGVTVEVGPADRPPLLRVRLSVPEATRLIASLQAVLNGSDEEIMMSEP
ncbi:MAG: hypothetical protein IT337_07550 [Thermomicrobiales bacterium]|nr:hypothetical protein [Thermomicrobiales bacterium]